MTAELTPAQVAGLRAVATSDGAAGWTDDKGRLVLPAIPRPDGHPALCRWLTLVFNLDPRLPITGAARRGLLGPKGQVYVYRAGASTIMFDPISSITSAPRLIEQLACQTTPTDGMVRDFKATHCRQIIYVISMLAAIEGAISEAQLAAAIVGDLLQIGAQVQGLTTYGTSAQRFEAACALVREVNELTGRRCDQPRYLTDSTSAEYVIAVHELQDVARRHIGSSLPRGYLDGILGELGWERVCLDGHERPRPDRGRHRRVDAYRGVLADPEADQ